MVIEPTKRGLFCAAGNFYIDPWRAVDRAVVTHAHSDHARAGCRHYLCSESGLGVLQQRVGTKADFQTSAWGQPLKIGDARVTLFPAGHLLGSAQVRVEVGGETWVVSGDYKTQADLSCEAFEPVPCHTFITESTFGLPIYRWPSVDEVMGSINSWWKQNQEQERTSILFAYALGKAQRILCGVDPEIGPIGAHGSVMNFLPLYRAAGKPMPEVMHATREHTPDLKGKGLVIAPGSVQNGTWLRKFAPYSLAFASGWMMVRGTRRWRALDRGFVLSDHADWDGLIGAIRATGAERIGVTHGYTGPMVRWLQDQGWEAFEVPTRFVGEAASGEEIDEEDDTTDREDEDRVDGGV